MTDAERRFTAVRVEVRAAADSRTIDGYAAKFDKLSQNLGGFVEQINQRAFNKSHGDNWPGVMARYNHDDNQVLGTTAGNTLRLSIDEIGLRYSADLPTARADVYELIQRNDVSQSSFAFIAFEDEWGVTRDTNYPMRTLHSVRLIDVAPVNTPAYLDTSVGVRSGRSIDLRSLVNQEQRVGGALVGPGAAYESMARHFDADISEVRRLAESDELIKFFKRSDTFDPAAAKADEASRSAEAALMRVRNMPRLNMPS